MTYYLKCMPLKITYKFRKKGRGEDIQVFAFGEKNVQLRKPRLKICVH